MKGLVWICCGALVMSAAIVDAQEKKRGEATAIVAGGAVSINYSRLSLKGRDIAPADVDSAWRMDADAAMSLKTEAGLSFGAVVIPTGEYIITVTAVGAGGWQLNLRDKGGKRVAKVPLKAAKMRQSVDEITVGVKGEKDRGEIELQWGTTALMAEFTVAMVGPRPRPTPTPTPKPKL